MRVAVLGAGDGGTAMAAYLASGGHRVRLWNRSVSRLGPLRESRIIVLHGVLSVEGRVELVTDDLADAVADAEAVFVVTTADAHGSIARQLAPLVREGQILLLNPGRTGGALEVAETFRAQRMRTRVFVAEAQSLVFACRADHPGRVRILGVKKHVPVAALPGKDTAYVVDRVRTCFECFRPASSVLETSLENIGAMFHPAVVLFNAAAIERGSLFYFYRDMSERIAAFLLSVDEERLLLGKRYGLALTGVCDWIGVSYPESSGDDLLTRMKSNPAYQDIVAPGQLDSRQLTEDVPTGLVPYAAFGEAAGLDLPLIRSMTSVLSSLMGRDFTANGRTLRRLGLDGMSVEQIIRFVSNGR